MAEFVSITTADTNRTLYISKNHLIPLLDCDEVASFESKQLEALVYTKSRFAHRATPGMCVAVLQDDNQLKVEKIAAVGRQYKTGIYSPITPQGTLVVDGVYVSCYATMENHFAQYMLHLFFVQIHRAVKSGLQYFGLDLMDVDVGDSVDIPLPMKLMSSVANLILSESMY